MSGGPTLPRKLVPWSSDSSSCAVHSLPSPTTIGLALEATAGSERRLAAQLPHRSRARAPVRNDSRTERSTFPRTGVDVETICDNGRPDSVPSEVRLQVAGLHDDSVGLVTAQTAHRQCARCSERRRSRSSPSRSSRFRSPTARAEEQPDGRRERVNHVALRHLENQRTDVDDQIESPPDVPDRLRRP
jgi:hypothetical protein